MCGFCGLFSIAPHWSMAAPVAERSAPASERLLAAARKMLSASPARLSAFGSRIRVMGPTGRCEIVDNVGALWPALDRMNLSVDPLDPDIVTIMEQRRWK
jgi:hypothetical protein